MLVVEGDGGLRAELAATLTSAGNEVEAAGSGHAGLALAHASAPAIVVLELNLPDMSGLEVCRALTATRTRRPAVLVLTSARSEEDRVAAFEAGVDDYVTKPHSMRELVLRVRALARRRGPTRPLADTLDLGTLRIDPAARRVEVGGDSPELTRRELDVLLFLAERAGRVSSRDDLVQRIWGETPESGRVVDTTVKRLRKKLGQVGGWIKTVRGVGYKLEPGRGGGA